MKVGDIVKFKSSDKGYTIVEIVCIRRDRGQVYYDIFLRQKGKLISGLHKDLLEPFEEKETNNDSRND